ncbi:hypothetical protein FGO68_gene2704 [Halteria grandinella]|uniref:Uncharacterized protein n=1 Tax=Halteria grandinella TaxID=5974 RepID=A0A8J8NX66_HALGN|nr:hypothetical protein FGO68_gene2704 [Halteria grandinella]
MIVKRNSLCERSCLILTSSASRYQKLNLKELDFTKLSKSFNLISELELNLLTQTSIIVDVDLPKQLRTLILWEFNKKNAMGVLRNLPPSLQLIKFMGNIDVELNEKCIEYIQKVQIRQLYISNFGLKNIQYNFPKAFAAYIKQAQLIYFGLESFSLKAESDYSFIQLLLDNCKAVANDGNPITLNVSNVSTIEELWPCLNKVAPTFKQVRLIIAEEQKMPFRLTQDMKLRAKAMTKASLIRDLIIEKQNDQWEPIAQNNSGIYQFKQNDGKEPLAQNDPKRYQFKQKEVLQHHAIKHFKYFLGRNLRSLSLPNLEVDDSALKKIARLPSLTDLTIMLLDYNSIGQCIILLAMMKTASLEGGGKVQSKRMLRSLRLKYFLQQSESEAGIAIYKTRLTKLVEQIADTMPNLEEFEIGVIANVTLIHCMRRMRLRSLRVTGGFKLDNPLADLQGFLREPHLKSLRELEIGFTKIDRKSGEQLDAVAKHLLSSLDIFLKTIHLKFCNYYDTMQESSDYIFDLILTFITSLNSVEQNMHLVFEFNKRLRFGTKELKQSHDDKLTEFIKFEVQSRTQYRCKHLIEYIIN